MSWWVTAVIFFSSSNRVLFRFSASCIWSCCPCHSKQITVYGDIAFVRLSICFDPCSVIWHFHFACLFFSGWQKWRTRTVPFSPTVSLRMKVCEYITSHTHSNLSRLLSPHSLVCGCVHGHACMPSCLVWLGSHINLKRCVHSPSVVLSLFD